MGNRNSLHIQHLGTVYKLSINGHLKQSFTCKSSEDLQVKLSYHGDQTVVLLTGHKSWNKNNFNVTTSTWKQGNQIYK